MVKYNFDKINLNVRFIFRLMYLFFFLIILLLSIKYEEIILTYIFFILYLTYTYYITQLSFLFWFLIIIYSSALAIIFIITIMLFNIKTNNYIKTIYDFIPSKIYINHKNNTLIILFIAIFILGIYFMDNNNIIQNTDYILNTNLELSNNYINKIVINLYYNYFFSSIIILKLLLFYLFLIFKILK